MKKVNVILWLTLLITENNILSFHVRLYGNISFLVDKWIKIGIKTVGDSFRAVMYMNRCGKWQGLFKSWRRSRKTAMAAMELREGKRERERRRKRQVTLEFFQLWGSWADVVTRDFRFPVSALAPASDLLILLYSFHPSVAKPYPYINKSHNLSAVHLVLVLVRLDTSSSMGLQIHTHTHTNTCCLKRLQKESRRR